MQNYTRLGIRLVKLTLLFVYKLRKRKKEKSYVLSLTWFSHSTTACSKIIYLCSFLNERKDFLIPCEFSCIGVVCNGNVSAELERRGENEFIYFLSVTR